MSDGKKHHLIWRQNWKWVLPLSVLTYGAVDPFSVWNCGKLGCLSSDLIISIGVPLGYAMGRFIDPDLDQMGTTAAEGRIVNEIPVLGVFLYGRWSTYGAIFRRLHRSVWTHFPILSTAIRIIWQFYDLFIVLYLKNWTFPWIIQIFLGILIGLSFADFLHWLEDIRSKEIRISSKRKRQVTCWRDR